MKTLVHTKALCVCCRDTIILATIEDVCDIPIEQRQIGPRPVPSHREVTSMHCPKCGLQYHHPPGRPNAAAEILEELREAERAREEESYFPSLDFGNRFGGNTNTG